MSNQSNDPITENFKILAADDQPEIRRLIQFSVESAGFEVELFESGDTILESMLKSPPDLVLLDVMMPGLDGYDVVQQMRSHPSLDSVYVIMVTAKSSLEDKLEGFESGADDYLTKPFQPKELVARLRAGLRIQGLQKKLKRSHSMMVVQEKRATIGRLAAGISHEFNNLMGAISGYAQLARSNPKYVDRLIEVALNQVERAQKITSSLATFAGSGNVERRPIELSGLVESTLLLIGKELQKYDVVLQNELSENMPIILGDRGQLQQVFLHLILNAAQAVENNGEIVIRSELGQDEVSILIDDNGCGIPEDLKTQVFDPFYTTKGALGASEEPGTGLGLSFVSNIINELGGKVEIIQSLLGGTCFKVSLPMQQSIDKPASEGSKKELSLPQKVLVVEPERNFENRLKDYFEPTAIQSIKDPSFALKYCQLQPPELLFLDVEWEGDSGAQKILDSLGQSENNCIVVASSSCIPAAEVKNYPAVVSIVDQPVDSVELIKALNKISNLRAATSA